jgi:integrase
LPNAFCGVYYRKRKGVVLQDWLGHANIQNTVIYTALVSTSREAKARQHFLKLPKF